MPGTKLGTTPATPELFLKGHHACAGCGSALCMRWILKALGPETVVANATGCMEIISTAYPNSQWGVPYIHSLFENTPAVASGVSRAFKQLKKKGTVACVMGDGAAYDIGFGALSGAMERNEDFIAVVYDNEAYMNTGVQRSGATPIHASTTTSPREVQGKKEWKKNLAFTAAMHGVPYVANASVGFIPDFEAKLRKARGISGFRLISVHCPCPIGWHYAPSQTIQIARQAVKCGVWNLFEIDDGLFKFSLKPKLEPVDDYLRAQGRFSHLTPEHYKEIGDHAKRTRTALERLEASGINIRFIL